MPSLQGVLARIPGLAGYAAGQEEDRIAQSSQLQQVGALQAIQANVQKQQMAQKAMQKEAAFRDALSRATTPEEQARVAAQFGSPDAVMRSTQGHLDRQSAIEAARINHQAQREARMAEIQQRGEQEIARVREAEKERRITKQEADAREATMRESMARLVASLRPAPAPEPLQAVVGDGGKGVLLPRSQAVGKEPYTARDTPAKALPSALTTKYLENIQNLRKAEKAMSLLEGEDAAGMVGDKNATGNKGLLTNLGVLGDKALNALDPKGVDARAAIGDLGSMVIHDRSGAAVTAAEFPRLRPFIPLASDAPEVARKKVKRFVQEYKAEIEAQKEFFSASGYKVPELTGGSAIPEFATEADAIKSGVKGKVKIGGRNATIE